MHMVLWQLAVEQRQQQERCPRLLVIFHHLVRWHGAVQWQVLHWRQEWDLKALSHRSVQGQGELWRKAQLSFML